MHGLGSVPRGAHGGGDWRQVETDNPLSPEGRAAAFANELRRLMPEITQRMLTLQLRALEKDGIVLRTVHEQVPPKVEYALSPHGWTLGPILEAMILWGEEHGAAAAPAAE